MQIPEDIQACIWKVYFKEHVVHMFMKQVVNKKGVKDIYDIALNRRTGLKSIYLKLYTGDSTSNIFQVYCDYGDINDYDLYEDTSFVNLPDSKRPKHWKHNSRYGCPSKKNKK